MKHSSVGLRCRVASTSRSTAGQHCFGKREAIIEAAKRGASSGEGSGVAQGPAIPLNQGRKRGECIPNAQKAMQRTKWLLARKSKESEMSEIKTTCVSGAATLAIVLAAAPAAAWEPTKPVEIVVAAGAGGASDQMARMMQAAIQKNNLMKQPMVVSLKGGASGAEALIYMKSNEGDPNKVLIAYSLIYMLPLSAKIPFNWRDLTPVSVIALDQFALWVNTQLPYKTVKDFTDAAKTASPPFKMGGTGSRREDHVLTVFLEKKTGAKFAYLPYKSGGEAATQLVGNHTAANVNNPSENLEVWRAGQVRALCVFDKERIEYKAKVTAELSWNDIPTCKEQGLDIQYLMLRAMFLPGKVTPEQTAFYVDLFKKLTQTAEYKDYMEKQALKPVFLTGKDMLNFLEEDDTLNKNLMTEAGFVAN
jgi:putative tricarboxylic transport membrane protein